MITQMRDDGLHDIHHAEDIGLENAADRFLRGRLEDREDTDAGIVDDGVDMAKAPDAGGNGGLDADGIGDVERQDKHLIGIVGGEALVRLAHCRDDVPALGGEVPCSALAQS